MVVSSLVPVSMIVLAALCMLGMRMAIMRFAAPTLTASGISMLMAFPAVAVVLRMGHESPL